MIVAREAFPKPGHRALVELVGSETQYERTYLWPLDEQEWAAHTPDDNVVFERLDEYLQCRDMSGRDSFFSQMFGR